jgi:ribosomal protein S18 acetylase RimI-like enzyme
MAVTIEQATIDDVNMLSSVAQLTFPMAGPVNASKKEVSKYISEKLNVSVFQKLIESHDACVVCAKIDEKLIGFFVLKYFSNPPNNENLDSSAELQKLYVLKEYHGANAAKLLVSEAFKECVEKGMKNIWLNVYNENSRAKKFYSKFNFQETGKTYFQMGNEQHLDIVMVATVV